jgi:hypothetical protein
VKTPTNEQQRALYALMREWEEEYGPALWTDLRRQLWAVAEGRWWQVKDDDIVTGVIDTLRSGDWSEWIRSYGHENPQSMIDLLRPIHASGEPDQELAAWAMEHMIIRPDERQRGGRNSDT